jgi:hypothetical protein
MAFGQKNEAYYGIVRCSDPGCTGPKELKPGFHAYRAAIRQERQSHPPGFAAKVPRDGETSASP